MDGPLAWLIRHALDERGDIGPETGIDLVENVPRHDFDPGCTVWEILHPERDVVPGVEGDDVDLGREGPVSVGMRNPGQRRSYNLAIFDGEEDKVLGVGL